MVSPFDFYKLILKAVFLVPPFLLSTIGGKVVVDNPPFSILTKICEYYIEHNIPFFLFAPSLTIFAGKNTATRMNHIICDCSITYENGAIVKTSFVTSYGYPTILESCPVLTKIINDKNRELRRKTKRKLPQYEYPDEIVTSAMVQKFSRLNIDFKVKKHEAVRIRGLDSQRSLKKEIFGSGLLLSAEKAAEKVAAEKVAAEKAAAEKVTVQKWVLSEREKEIVKSLGNNIEENY